MFGPFHHVDEAHCCDTSRSLRILIGRHSQVTSSNKGANPHLWMTLVQIRLSIQIPTELASLSCTLQYSLADAYWVLNTHTWENWICVAVYDAHRRKGRERPDIALLQPDLVGLAKKRQWWQGDSVGQGHFPFCCAAQKSVFQPHPLLQNDAWSPSMACFRSGVSFEVWVFSTQYAICEFQK